MTSFVSFTRFKTSEAGDSGEVAVCPRFVSHVLGDGTRKAVEISMTNGASFKVMGDVNQVIAKLKAGEETMPAQQGTTAT